MGDEDVDMARQAANGFDFELEGLRRNKMKKNVVFIADSAFACLAALLERLMQQNVQWENLM